MKESVRLSEALMATSCVKCKDFKISNLNHALVASTVTTLSGELYFWRKLSFVFNLIK